MEFGDQWDFVETTMEFAAQCCSEDASETKSPQNNSKQALVLPVSSNEGRSDFESNRTAKEVEVHVKGGDAKFDHETKILAGEQQQDLVTMKQKFVSTVVPSINERDRERDLKESSLQHPIHQNDHIIDIPGPEELEPFLLSEWCIYKVPSSLWKVKKVAFTPLLVSIGPVHHNKEELKEMQKQKYKYYHYFRARLGKEPDLRHYKDFLEQEEQNLRVCYQMKFSDISKEQFVEMMLLDAVFIMELFLREADRGKHKDDYLVTQRCVSKSIQRDLMLLENQLPIVVLKELYDRVVPSNVRKESKFIKLAYEYFISYYPNQQSSASEFELSEWEKSLHFTDLIRNSYLPKELNSQKIYSQKESVLRTATKLNRAGISFEKVDNRCLLDIKFKKKRFFRWFVCLGCLPYCKFFKARLQIPQLRVDHTTECVLRNLIAFEQCHYPEEPYICNYVSLIDSLIHTIDDAELLVEKEAIVHELGSDQELTNLVNGLCKHVVTNSTCYDQIIKDVNGHYNNKWKWIMGTLRWVYFRDPWRTSSTIVGTAVLVFTFFNY